MLETALVELADIANCVSGDMHLMHLQIRGAEFDAMHKVLKKYYEQAAGDYDTWAEAALMFSNARIDSPNGSAARLQWQEFGCVTGIDKAAAVGKINELLEAYCQAMVLVRNGLKDDEHSPINIGIMNKLEDRISFWSKELYFFNMRRV